MSPILLGICVLVAMGAGWWVGAKVRAQTREPKSLAGKARKAARRSLGSLFKQVLGRAKGEQEPEE